MSGWNENRFIMALYYAFGRKDAGDTVVDPMKFAEHYDLMYQEFRAGASGFMPSVQDAWDQHRRHEKHRLSVH